MNGKAGRRFDAYSPALKVAGSILADSRLPRREAVLISDFQRGGWRGEEGARLPQGATLTPVADSGRRSTVPNLSVTGDLVRALDVLESGTRDCDSGPHQSTERPATSMMVKLEVAGSPVGGAKPFSSSPGGTTSVTFDPFTVGARNMQGHGGLGEDALLADNVYHFVVGAGAAGAHRAARSRRGSRPGTLRARSRWATRRNSKPLPASPKR